MSTESSTGVNAGIEESPTPTGVGAWTSGVIVYEGNRRTTEGFGSMVNCGAPAEPIVVGGSRWSWTRATTDLPDGGSRWELRFTLEEGEADNAAVALRLDLADWSVDHYLLMPAAVYAGNRFTVAPSRSVDSLPDGELDPSVLITPPVPRLAIGDGESLIQLLTSDLSFPAVAIHDPHRKRGLILLTEDRTPHGLSGLRFVESDDRRSARLELTAPGVREGHRHNGRPSTDRGAKFAAGDEASLCVGVYDFDCPDVQALYDKLFAVRHALRPEPRVRHDIPFASVWQIQHRKYNEQNWVEKYGYYAVGMRESQYQDWQTGWVGGANTLYALLAEGDSLTGRRSLREIDFILTGGQTPSGLFRGHFHEGQWSDDTRTFLRYSADALYFLCKSLRLVSRRDGGDQVTDRWRDGVRRCADAFCTIWRNHGQFGHYGDTREAEIRVGGTCAASTAIGGLALASDWLGEPAYRDVAQQAGEYYHQRYVLAGLTNAGPGDILQCPDSESCFGLLESFMTLYETTGEPRWLTAAANTAHQAATWVTNYDFRFPRDSTFGKLDMLTNGTVWANIQNKHSAPGICTLSGCSLLKLFRASGDPRYLEFCRDIAHAIPQYMSREDRPIVDVRPNQPWPVMPAGWINERVNMSDWEVRGDPDDEIGVGEIFGGSTWSEAAMMLTWAELPGLYAQPDTGLLCALDHVDAKWLDDRRRIEIHNPTPFHAEVKLLIETQAEARQTMLGPTPMVDARRCHVERGQTASFEV